MRKAGEVCYGAAHGDVGKNKGVVCYDRKEVTFSTTITEYVYFLI